MDEREYYIEKLNKILATLNCCNLTYEQCTKVENLMGYWEDIFYEKAINLLYLEEMENDDEK